MMARVFISRDAGARSVGSDRVADAVTAEARRRGIDLSLVRVVGKNEPD